MNRVEQGMAAYLGKGCLAYLQSVGIGIAGAGGLGSNCAMHLVRAGFKRFVLVDFDRVDFTNLNRQVFSAEQVGEFKVHALSRNMLAVNRDIDCIIRNERLAGKDMLPVFAGCDVVIEAFDSPEAKKALVETLLPTGKLVVAASGIGGSGNSGAMVTRKVRENFYLVGDGETECSGATPPLSPRVGLAAAMQADVVLDHFLRLYEEQGGA